MDGQDNTSDSYQYQLRKGVRPVSWEDFHGLCQALARAIDRDGAELILAVGRGGYYPGTLIAHMLQLEIYPIRLSRRVNDVIQYQRPRWIIPPEPDMVRNRRVVIVDEICGSGETLMLVKTRVEAAGVRDARCAVLYAHTKNTEVPDYIGLISDKLFLNPWDREILVDGSFQFHPEYTGALAKQGIETSDDLRIHSNKFRLAKSP